MADTTPTPGFFDGLGDRVIVRDRTVGALEVLRLRPDLTADAEFEPCVRARIQQLAGVQHPGLGRVRHVGRLAAPDNRLAVVSDLADGFRLSEVLQAIEQADVPLHTNAVLFLLRQLVAAVSCLQGVDPDVSHGALGPERLVISATGRLVVVEHVLGTAMRHVPHPQPARVWKDLRIALAAGEEPPFGRRGDVLQIGLCGLAMVLGRPLRLEEFPQRLVDLLDHATESTVTGDRRPLRAPLRAWLAHAMEVGEPGEAPWTIDEARHALDALLASDGYLATPTGLATLIQTVKRYFAGADFEPKVEATAQPAAPAPVAAPASASAEAVSLPPVAAPAAPVAAPAAPAPVASSSQPVSPSHLDGLAAPAAQPVSHLRLVPPAAPAGSPSPSWASPLAAARELGTARTEGSLAVATAFPAAADLPDHSFAPEAGVSFPPDEPEPEPVVTAPTPPPPPRPTSGAVPIAAAAAAAPSSGAEPVAGPLADSLAEPIAGSVTATLARESLAGMVHSRPGRADGSGAHRIASGPARSTRSMFDTDADRMPPSHAGRSSLPLKLAGAGGLVAALAVAGWFILGGRPAADKPSPRPARPAAQASVPAAEPSKAAAPVPDRAAPPAPAGSETLPASLAGAAAAAEAAGSLQLETPFPLEVFEDGTRLGTSDGPIVLAAGRHQVELVNRDYEFRGRQVVDVRPGRATRVVAKLPAGVAHINATPWAEVWVDGARAGDTPLGNLALTIGPHEIVFRHPQLGEQTRTLVVTAGAPARLSVEMQQ